MNLDLDKLVRDLDKNQKKAVTAENKNALCVSIAGSGKTRVLTRRVAYLIHKGVKEEEIILLTFTNKASNEMLYRVKALLGKEKINVLGGTFHSVATRFLRKYAKELGYESNFTILTPDDCVSIIKDIREDFLKEMKIKKENFPKARVIYNMYSNSVNLNEEIEYLDSRFNKDIMYKIKTIVGIYNREKKDSNSMDFDDLLVHFNKLLDINRIRKELNEQYKYILVDEFQDVNYLQYEITKKLNGSNNNLFVVGDPNQGIYSWRGSKVDYINNFHKDYDCNIFTINKNYRCDGKILRLAEDSINNNYQPEPVRMIPFKESENTPILINYSDDYQQADILAFKIKQLINKGVNPNEIAILLRGTFLTVKTLETALRRYDVGYILRAGFSYFERKHIKDIIAFLTLLENPKSEENFKRVFKLLEGIGGKTAKKIYDYYASVGYNFNTLKDDVISKKIKLGKKPETATLLICDIVLKVKKSSKISEMIDQFMKLFYDNYLAINDEDYKERIEEIKYLEDTADNFSNLQEFLSEITLEPEEDEKDSKKKNPRDCIIISTIHKAKGLEWEYVYLPYLNEEIFPNRRVINDNNEEQWEEERRLFYVAVTRAKKHLEMSYVNYTTINREPYIMSRFIQEVDSKLYIAK